MPAIPTPATVLTYWFGTYRDDAATAQAQRTLWWSKDSAVDATIRNRFAALVLAAAFGKHDDWARDPLGRLALIVLFDQFPRNMYRESPRAFAFDSLARQLALEGIATAASQALRPIERVFTYLPLEHAEDLALQDRSVALFSALASAVPATDRPLFEGYVDFAERHRAIIRRFGRFPHRNRVLGRPSTLEEVAFLEQPGSSF